MGLSVSQVRLLALTSRKADIELQMQVNSKRKQMLTRQSTELAQQYYQRLQNANIKYATSSGYEDVTYGYLMGYSVNGHITDEFYEQLMTGADNNLPMKSENRMILTNNFGEVVVDQDIARYIGLGVASGQSSVLGKTASAIGSLVMAHKGGSQAQLAVLAQELSTLGDEKALDVITVMIQNGGYQSGGTLYRSEKDTNVYYKTAAAAAKANADPTAVSTDEIVKPIDGYCYDIRDASNRSLDVSKMYLGNSFVSVMTSQYAKYLGALVSYFAPIISAGIQNGISCAIETTNSTTADNTTSTGCSYSGYGDPLTSATNAGKNCGAKYTGAGYTYDKGNNNVIISGHVTDKTLTASSGGSITDGEFDTNGSDYVSAAINWFAANGSENQYLAVTGNQGTKYFFRGRNQAVDKGSTNYYMTIQSVTKAEYNRNKGVNIGDNPSYDTAQDVSKLQAGFQSGAYQLAMVDDITRGAIKRNTMLNYFTQMNYVVEKTDSSKREEITAWFNAEQALISEKETYWDAEIQNLSTELNSVNTEIESVKTLKSNAIKSVFDWGSS